MKTSQVIHYIVQWLQAYSRQSGTKGFVVGVSGGIDSAVTSTLCAMTGKPVLALNLPILQPSSQLDRSLEHIQWLTTQFNNVKGETVDLTESFIGLTHTYPKPIQDQLTMANVRSRLRMTTLYAFAGHHGYLVAGTGNKIEDFGIGFFTKYGDGGVDLSPIADLTKTQVYEVARELGIVNSIQTAKPTDGLWDDDRSDEDQIGATYPELEWAMEFEKTFGHNDFAGLTERQIFVLQLYRNLNKANQHKMHPIPVCLIPDELM
jgi:NAD+ synthase